MKVEIQKGLVRQWVGEQYLAQFLEKGWAPVSNTGPKKVSKNAIKATADVIEAAPVEAEPQSNPPEINEGD